MVLTEAMRELCGVSFIRASIPLMGLPRGSEVKNPPAKAGDMSSIPGWGRSPGEGNGNPLQYSYLGSPMDRGVWWATVHGVTKELDTAEQLNNGKSH